MTSFSGGLPMSKASVSFGANAGFLPRRASTCGRRTRGGAEAASRRFPTAGSRKNATPSGSKRSPRRAIWRGARAVQRRRVPATLPEEPFPADGGRCGRRRCGVVGFSGGEARGRSRHVPSAARGAPPRSLECRRAGRPRRPPPAPARGRARPDRNRLSNRLSDERSAGYLEPSRGCHRTKPSDRSRYPRSDRLPPRSSPFLRTKRLERCREDRP